VHLAAQRPSRQASIAPMLTEAQLDALDASALTSGTRAASHAAPLTPTDRASREFGPEQALAAGSGRAAAAAAAAAVRGPTARSAATRPELSASAGSTPATEAPTRDSAGAEREFSPG
jgi:hypothetical protein